MIKKCQNLQSPRDWNEEGADDELGVDGVSRQNVDNVAHIHAVAAERQGNGRGDDVETGWHILSKAQDSGGGVLRSGCHDGGGGGGGQHGRATRGGDINARPGKVACPCRVKRGGCVDGSEGRGDEGHFGRCCIGFGNERSVDVELLQEGVAMEKSGEGTTCNYLRVVRGHDPVRIKPSASRRSSHTRGALSSGYWCIATGI